MALPLKTGADLYNQQLIRARLQNLGAQPNTADVGLGQVYFNTGTNTAASLRIGYCYETGSVPKFHHVANLEDVNRLEELISALSGSSSESVASVLGRVITLEGYFSNGKAKDADLLDGHNSDYFATATTVNDLLEDYESFKAVFADNSDDYINTWTEVKNFLDGIKNTEDLNAILLGINTELGKKADKATTLDGYGITDAAKYYGTYSVDSARYGVGYDNMSQGSVDLPVAGGGFIAATQGKYGFQIVGGYSSAGHMFWRRVENGTLGTWRKVLDDNNYASVLDGVYFKTTGGSINGSTTITGQSFSILQLYANAAADSAVGFYNTNGLLGYLGMSAGGDLGFWNKDWTFWRVLHAGNYSNLITNLNNNLNVPSITIGGIKLSVVEGQLQIEGDAFATGQLSSGGIGSEGSGSGASGIVILEDWEKYDDTLAQVLGAGLGVGLRDKIAALESKATNVSVAQTLTSGKEIGAITIDGVATKLFAPSTYAWSEITSKPISLGGYGIIDAVRLLSSQQGNYAIKTHLPAVLVGYTGEEKEGISGDYGILNIPIWSANTESLYYATQIYSAPNATNLCWRQVTASANGAWKVLLDDHNYESIVGNKFLKLTGGTITGALYIEGGYDSKLIFNNTDADTNYNQILFQQDGSLYGVLGTTTGGVLHWNYFPILHAGNFNSYAPTLTGVGASGTWGIDISGSAAKATKLQTARSLWGNSFDGTADVNTHLTLNANDAALAAWKKDGSSASLFLQVNPDRHVLIGQGTARENGGLYLYGNDIRMCYGNAGSSNNTAMLINSSGNVTIGASDLASTNYKLYVDGSTKIAGTIYDVNNIYPNSAGEKYIGTSTNPFKYMYAEWFGAGTGQTLSFGANNATHIWVNTSGNVGIGTVNPSEKLHVNGSGIFGASTETKIRLNNGNIGIAGNTYQRIIGGYSNDYSSVLGGLNIYVASNALQLLWLGTNSERWLSADARYSTLEADWRLWANAGLTIPTGQTLKIGDATLSWDSTANALKINKDFYSDGQVSSGGVAEEGTGGAVGGGSLDRVVFTIPAQTTSFTCEHNLGTREISVTIYEEGNDYQQVLADVYLDSTNIARVVFGSATDVAHKVVIIG